MWALWRAKTPATQRLRESLTSFVGVSAIAQGYHTTHNKGRLKFFGRPTKAKKSGENIL